MAHSGIDRCLGQNERNGFLNRNWFCWGDGASESEELDLPGEGLCPGLGRASLEVVWSEIGIDIMPGSEQRQLEDALPRQALTDQPITDIDEISYC